MKILFSTLFLTISSQYAFGSTKNCLNYLSDNNKIGAVYFKNLYKTEVRLSLEQLVTLFKFYNRAKNSSQKLTAVKNRQEALLIKSISNLDFNIGDKVSSARAEKIMLSALFKLAIKAGYKYKHIIPNATNDEITQSVMTGFVRALNSYNPDDGYMFSSFLYRSIYTQLLRDMELTQGPIRAIKLGDYYYPRVLRHKALIENSQGGKMASLEQILNSYNSVEEKPLDLSTVKKSIEKHEVLKNIHSTTAKLMDLNEDDLFSDYYQNLNLVDFLKDDRLDPFEEHFLTETTSLLMDLIKGVLTQREFEIFSLREPFGKNMFYDPLSYDQIGRLFGVTRERIRQIEAKAKRKLKRRLTTDYKFRDIIEHYGLANQLRIQRPFWEY